MDPENDLLVDDEIPSDELPDDEPPVDDAPPSDDPPGGDEPPAEPAAKAKPAAPAKVEPPAPQPRQPQTVPLATFLQEKTKFTSALDAERERVSKLEQELAALKNPPKAPPKYEEDPKGFIEHATKSAAKDVLDKLEEQGKQIGKVVGTAEQTAEQRAEQAFLEDLAQTEAAFVQEHDDYADALTHVRTIAYRQLKVYYPEATEAQLVKAITQQELQMAKQATSAGRNPHEVAYALALANGYQKKAPPPAPAAKGKPAAGKPGKAATPPVDTGPSVLDPDLTLGRSNGEAPDDDAESVPDPDTFDAFDEALNEVFKPRKRA